MASNHLPSLSSPDRKISRHNRWVNCAEQIPGQVEDVVRQGQAPSAHGTRPREVDRSIAAGNPVGRLPHFLTKRLQAAYSQLRELASSSRNHALSGIVTFAHGTVNKVPQAVRWRMAHSGTIVSDDRDAFALQDLAEQTTLAAKGLKIRKQVIANHAAPKG